MKNLITTDHGVTLVIDKKEPRVSHFDIAKELEIQAYNAIRQVDDWLSDFEELGVVVFQTRKPPKGTEGGRPERVAYLNEDQCFLLLSYSRNTATVRRAKINRIKAFKAAREALAQNKEQYLPLYHACHDSVHQIAIKAKQCGSTTPERMYHMNVERLINKTLGIEAGTRHTLKPQQKAAVSMAYLIYEESCMQTLEAGLPANDAYAMARPRIEQLAAMTNTQRLERTAC